MVESSRPIPVDPAERANTFPWPPLLFFGVIAAAYGLGSLAALTWPGVVDAPARWIGRAFGLTGLALVGWAVWMLRRHETTVMPDGVSTALVTSGPYRRFRNPIYLGEAMILLGLAEATKNIWFVAAALLFTALVTVLQIIPEERHLEQRFGDAYRRYKVGTRRWI